MIMKEKNFSQTDYQNAEIEREKIEKRERRKDNIIHVLLYLATLVIAFLFGLMFYFSPRVGTIVVVLLLMAVMDVFFDFSD